MKNKVLTGIAVAVLMALTGHYLFMRSDLIVGDPAPDFIYENRAGETSALSDFSGKYVILSFWGSWCIPCRASNKKLREFYKEAAPEEIVIISVGLERKREDWEKAIEEDSLVWKEQFTSLEMMEDAVAQKFKIELTPTYFLIGPRQKILSKSEDIDEIIEKYRQQKS